jgi:hypothetical protein
MSKLFYKAMIEDIQRDQCSHKEVEHLLDVFTYAVKRTATTMARKAWFQLGDFANTKNQGIDRFTLTVDRIDVRGQEQWWGIFEYGSKKLKVIATLEKN